MGFISNAWHAITHPTEEIGKVANVVTKTAENIVHNPVPVIETVALTAALGPAGLGVASSLAAPAVAGAAVQAMNGGSVKNIAVAAISGYVGAQVANAAPGAINSLVTSSNPLGSLGVDPNFISNNITIASSALGASAQATTSALLKGQSLSNALQAGVKAAATSGIYSAIGSLAVDTGISKQINSVVNDVKNQVLPLLNQASPAVSNVLGSLFVDSTPAPSQQPNTFEPSSAYTPAQIAAADTNTKTDVVAPTTGALPVSDTNLSVPPGVPSTATPETDENGDPIYVNYPTATAYDAAGNQLPGIYMQITTNDASTEGPAGPPGQGTGDAAPDNTTSNLDIPAIVASQANPSPTPEASTGNIPTATQEPAPASPIDAVTPTPPDQSTVEAPVAVSPPSPIDTPQEVTPATPESSSIPAAPAESIGALPNPTTVENVNAAQNGTVISPSPIDSGLPVPGTVTASDTGTSTYYGQPTELGTTTNFQDNTSTTAYQDPGTGQIIDTNSSTPVTPTTGTASPGCTPSNIKIPLITTPTTAPATPSVQNTTPADTSSVGGLPARYWLSSAPQVLTDVGSGKPVESLAQLPALNASMQAAAPSGASVFQQQLNGLAMIDPELANKIANNQITPQELADPRILDELKQYDPRLLQQFAQRGYTIPGMHAKGGAIKKFASGGNSPFNAFCLSACTFVKNLAPTHISYAPPPKTQMNLGALQQLSPQMSIYGSFGHLAKGGLPSKYHEAAPEGHHPEFVTGVTGYYAGGRGTGQSDDIPAMLHDGDYVIDADAVAALGDGSSKAGNESLMHFMSQVPHKKQLGDNPVPAKIADGEVVLPESFVTALGGGDNKHGAKMLDQMRERLRDHKRSAPNSKIPPKAKSPLEYLRGKG